MPAVAILPTAMVIPREPNQARFKTEQHNESRLLNIPHPQKPPHGGSIYRPERPAAMRFAFGYDPNYKMSGRERWHLSGAHTVIVPGAKAPRGRMLGFIRRRPIRREVPQSYGQQVPEVTGYEDAYYYREG